MWRMSPFLYPNCLLQSEHWKVPFGPGFDAASVISEISCDVSRFGVDDVELLAAIASRCSTDARV